MSGALNWTHTYLDVNEAVLWHGKPQALPFWANIGLFPLSLGIISLILGFALLPSEESIIPLLFALLLLVYLPFYKARIIKQTEYVVAQRHLLIKRGRKVSVLHAAQLPPPVPVDGRMGSYTIKFDIRHATPQQQFGHRNSFFSFLYPNGLYALEHLYNTEDVLAAIYDMDTFA